MLGIGLALLVLLICGCVKSPQVYRADGMMVPIGKVVLIFDASRDTGPVGRNLLMQRAVVTAAAEQLRANGFNVDSYYDIRFREPDRSLDNKSLGIDTYKQLYEQGYSHVLVATSYPAAERTGIETDNLTGRVYSYNIRNTPIDCALIKTDSIKAVASASGVGGGTAWEPRIVRMVRDLEGPTATFVSGIVRDCGALLVVK